MIEISAILLFPLLSLLILFSLKQWWSRRHFPPGPPFLPIFGNVWAFQTRNKEDILKKLAKKYGNIYTLWLGNRSVVVLSGFKAVKEGLVGYGEEFGGRTLSAFFSSQRKGRGIVFANGHIWKKQRQIGNSSLRLFGPGNKMIEHQIKEEAQQLIEIFTCTKEVESHKQYQSLHDPQDFIDFYLLQMEKNKDDLNSVFSEENLACCLLELFIAGAETTYSSLMWAVLLLVNHPDIQ
ncbi:Cytochrome protein, partial [Ophiophagus hannah]